MKLRNIILTALASVALFASCEKEQDLGGASISVKPGELAFTEAASSQTVALKATRAWKLETSVPDWITVTPASGEASANEQTVTIEVKANEGSNRNVDLKFTIGLANASLKVAQAGPNGDQLEITTIKDFIAKADKQNPYVLQGTVIEKTTTERFWGIVIKDETGSISVPFPANWEEWKDKLEVGGKVTVKGPYEFFDKKQEHQVKKAEILAFEEGAPLPPAEQISVAEFIKKADSVQPYKLVGKVEKTAKGEKFWGFDLNDGTGVVTCAFPANWKEWESKIADGGTVTVEGTYKYYEPKQTHQVNKAKIISFEAGEGGVTPEPEPGEVVKATLKDFLAAAVGNTWYELTATIKDISSKEYGNIYLQDGEDVVYVYGLTKTKVDQNDNSFAQIGLKKGDKVTIHSQRGEFKGAPQAVGSYYISHEAGEVVPEKPDGPAKWDMKSSIVYENVDAAYMDKATINGTADIPVLKLGKSKGYGKASLTIPAGTKKLGFYAVAWKGEIAKLLFGNGTAVELERGNDGATKLSPYTLDGISAIDYYEIELKGDEGTLTVETVEFGKRAIVFGINPVK